MRSLHIYRTPSGKRILFRDSEIAEPPKYFSSTRRIELHTIYGSVYGVMSLSPETVVLDEEKAYDGVHHIFHWSP